MKLDKTSTNILSCLRGADGKSSLECALSPQFVLNYDLTYSELVEKCEISEQSMDEAISYLEENNFLKTNLLTNGMPASITLTHTGIHYKELRRNELFDLILSSILCPVIVTIITSITWANVSHYLLSTWEAIGKLIQSLNP